jgi:hypothetical protein
LFITLLGNSTNKSVAVYRSPDFFNTIGGLWTFAPDFLRELSDCAAVAGAAVRNS